LSRLAPRAALGLGTVTLLAACAPALHQPSAITQIAASLGIPPGPRATAPDVDRLLAEGQAHFARRPDRAEVAAAQRLFFLAAQADDTRVEGLLDLARASSWLVEHVSDRAERDRLVGVAIEATLWCARRAPANAACDYALAQALGQQARERPSTSHDGLERMVKALERAATVDPGMDDGGPDRVLALVYLRAPGWPLGPGNAEAGLAAAEKAVALAPAHPKNQLALAEALGKNARPAQARAAFEHAHALARQRASAGDPDADEWVVEAQRGLRETAPDRGH
jgi:tetratricopeptide (TPR) repeat protein